MVFVRPCLHRVEPRAGHSAEHTSKAAVLQGNTASHQVRKLNSRVRSPIPTGRSKHRGAEMSQPLLAPFDHLANFQF